MKTSPLIGSNLVRTRLLTTNCEIADPGLGVKEFQAEMTLDVNTAMQDRAKGATFDFFVDVTVALSLNSEGKDAVKVKTTFRGDYIFIDKNCKYTEQIIEEATPLFANQMLLVIRPHLAHVLTAMGLNSTFLPFHLPTGVAEKKKPSKAKA